MTPEHNIIPDWAQRERQADFAWIGENLHVFWPVATAAFEDLGRGALVIDTTSQPVPGAGHPFGYFSREQVDEYGDEDTRRMVAEYDPAQELILVLLKSGEHSSTYRVGTSPPESLDTPEKLGAVRPSGEAGPRPKLVPPEIETLMAWEAEGGCEAACPDHCWVEPDGVCSHGNPSWLRALGFI